MMYRNDFLEWLAKDKGISEDEYVYCLSGSEIQMYYSEFVNKFKTVLK